MQISGAGISVVPRAADFLVNFVRFDYVISDSEFFSCSALPERDLGGAIRLSVRLSVVFFDTNFYTYIPGKTACGDFIRDWYG